MTGEAFGVERKARVRCNYVVITKNPQVSQQDNHEQIRPGRHESLCNPVSQAELLNGSGCEFNVVLGLCVGHDSLFYRYSDGLATALVTKDRVLAHNPIGALQLADSYYDKVWGPDRPAKPPKLPAAGRRSKSG